ncbi:MAG TPA: TetR/AcrR family transcriptional regulator [Bacteroidales bacterium]|nr:TetR/AcrR family transcriptional regulator [Bacteroidales bacterium]
MESRFEVWFPTIWLQFTKYGIRSLSMDELCQHLGISKKTLYASIENKADLVQKVIDWHYHQEALRYLKILESGINAIDNLMDLSQAICKEIYQTNPVLLHDLQKYYPDIWASVVDRKRLFYQHLLELNLDQGLQQGLYRLDLDKKVTILLYVQSFEQFIGTGILPPLTPRCQDVFHVLFENHIRAITSADGLAYFETTKNSYPFNI